MKKIAILSTLLFVGSVFGGSINDVSAEGSSGSDFSYCTPAKTAPPKLTRYSQEQCHTSVSLPYITVVKNGATCNLLGRTQIERNLNVRKHSTWHRQVVDLFR